MERLNLLWQAAKYQEDLLQRYRLFNIIVQTGLILTAAILSRFINPISQDAFLCMILVGIYSLFKFRTLINARAKDVNYFHELIIKEESTLPIDFHVLTHFKQYQKNKLPEPIETEKEIKELLGKAKGHTRVFLEGILFYCFLLIWVLIAVSIFTTRFCTS